MRYITTAERIGIEKGEAKGFYTFLLGLLEERFEHVPSPYLEYVQKADAETLLTWGKRVLKASTLAEVFA